ncbi:MAG: hypothetical protein Q8M56_07255, partial [Desulfobacterales bacterium]|nr:hypothetical protein [Desulfobacterales bacterium]
GSSKTIDKTELINTINHIRFTGGNLFLLLQHPFYQDKLFASAHPEPCIENQLTLRLDVSYDLYRLDSYKPVHLVIDSGWFSPGLLFIAVTKLGRVYNLDKITLLVYPATYIESVGISYKKQYQLWITDMRYSNQFMDYVQGKFRMQYNWQQSRWNEKKWKTTPYIIQE